MPTVPVYYCRTSGVSSGATSGSSGTNLSYPALTSPVRKFTTLNRQSHQPKIKPNPVLRTRSFQVSHPKLSQFSPSENSAFHCISANNSRDLSQVWTLHINPYQKEVSLHFLPKTRLKIKTKLRNEKITTCPAPRLEFRFLWKLSKWNLLNCCPLFDGFYLSPTPNGQNHFDDKQTNWYRSIWPCS